MTQIEIDLKISLEEADQKRTVAEGIAEVVSKEKAIVEVETAKAQIQAKEVSIIQAEVGEKQRSTEADLAKAEPAVEAAMAALNTLDKKDLGEAKTMAKPPGNYFFSLVNDTIFSFIRYPFLIPPPRFDNPSSRSLAHDIPHISYISYSL